ncbi:hypothetical protein Pyrde_0863 [Pyrodictium delaneyi]|uniref:Uncharacterized protein n=1 Tax=Pyrodictium delaneyi TaxID=1273541 RepID=A0A0N7JD13_9CREN|nr:hypothetical protein [Pyrodictium delaneyi]ALL00913.1 hypothetical protein Pyrde_0863 [Pyrodictium delaneyi]
MTYEEASNIENTYIKYILRFSWLLEQLEKSSIRGVNRLHNLVSREFNILFTNRSIRKKIIDFCLDNSSYTRLCETFIKNFVYNSRYVPRMRLSFDYAFDEDIYDMSYLVNDVLASKLLLKAKLSTDILNDLIFKKAYYIKLASDKLMGYIVQFLAILTLYLLMTVGHASADQGCEVYPFYSGHALKFRIRTECVDNTITLMHEWGVREEFSLGKIKPLRPDALITLVNKPDQTRYRVIAEVKLRTKFSRESILSYRKQVYSYMYLANARYGVLILAGASEKVIGNNCLVVKARRREEVVATVIITSFTYLLNSLENIIGQKSAAPAPDKSIERILCH